MTPTDKDKRGVNYWIHGARNWARWQDFQDHAWDAAEAMCAWNDLPSNSREHIHTLLVLALREKHVRHEAEVSLDATDYYPRRLADISRRMSETAGRIE